jgi:hypothetical protein
VSGDDDEGKLEGSAGVIEVIVSDSKDTFQRDLGFLPGRMTFWSFMVNRKFRCAGCAGCRGGDGDGDCISEVISRFYDAIDARG